MQFLTNNTELIVTLLTMVLTWILGFLSKKCPYINNNLIIIQNIIKTIIMKLSLMIQRKAFSYSNPRLKKMKYLLNH